MTETREQQMAEVARQAANVIDGRGLFQGDFYDPWATDPDKCAVCAVGAVRLVLTGLPAAEADLAGSSVFRVCRTGAMRRAGRQPRCVMRSVGSVPACSRCSRVRRAGGRRLRQTPVSAIACSYSLKGGAPKPLSSHHDDLSVKPQEGPTLQPAMVPDVAQPKAPPRATLLSGWGSLRFHGDY